MNEEEIIEKVKSKIEKIKQEYSDDYLFSYYWTKNDVKNVEKVLDLYNQAKQQNLKLRLQELPRLQGEIDAYKEFLHQEKEKNKKLKEGIRQIKDKLEIADYYNCQDGADELTKLLQES